MKTSRPLLVGLAVLHLTCHQALFTAPPGTTIVLIPNPNFIPANTGISVITAILTESTGTPVADGTVTQCFTDLGRVDPEGRTNDGVAKINLYADSRSGIAHVTCVSGGPATAPSTPPTTVPTSTLGAGSVSSGGLSEKSASAVAEGTSTTVTIGSANPQSMFVTANPQRITNPRFTTIAANVFDAEGNPVANVPVFCTVDLPPEGQTLQETLDSAGAPRFTDNNGRATDILRTSYDPAEHSKTVSVTCIIPGGPVAPSVKIIVN